MPTPRDIPNRYVEPQVLLPEHFGGEGIGQAMKQAGSQIQEGATQMWDTSLKIQDVKNTTDAYNRMTNTLKQADDLLYGTRNPDGSVLTPGIMSLKGDDANRAIPVAQARLAQIFQQGAAGLNPMAANLYNQQTRFYMMRHTDALANLGIEQQKNAAQAANESLAAQAHNTSALNNNDDNMARQSIAIATQAAVQNYELEHGKGSATDAIKYQLQQQELTTNTETRARTAMNGGNVGEANRILQSFGPWANQDKLAPIYQEIKTRGALTLGAQAERDSGNPSPNALPGTAPATPTGPVDTGIGAGHGLQDPNNFRSGAAVGRPDLKPQVVGWLNEALKSLPPGYTARLVAGPANHTWGTYTSNGKQQSQVTMGDAADIIIVDPQGHEIPNPHSVTPDPLYRTLGEAYVKASGGQGRWGGHYLDPDQMQFGTVTPGYPAGANAPKQTGYMAQVGPTVPLTPDQRTMVGKAIDWYQKPHDPGATPPPEVEQFNNFLKPTVTKPGAPPLTADDMRQLIDEVMHPLPPGSPPRPDSPADIKFGAQVRESIQQMMSGNHPLAGGGGRLAGSPGPYTAGPADLMTAGQQAAAKYGVPWDVFSHAIAGESSWNPNVADSSAGAQGIAQFMPDTAKQYGVDVRNTQSSLDGAAHYLSDLHAKGGSWQSALTGYQTGTPNNRTIASNPEYAQAYQAAAAADGPAGQRYAQATPTTMTDASSGGPPPVPAAPAPLPTLEQLGQQEVDLAADNARRVNNMMNNPALQQNPEALRAGLEIRAAKFRAAAELIAAQKQQVHLRGEAAITSAEDGGEPTPPAGQAGVTTPQPSKPFGWTELTQQENALAEDNTRRVNNIMHNPDLRNDPEALKAALAIRAANFESAQRSLSAKKEALVVGQNTATAEYIKEINQSGGPKPDITQRMYNDPRINNDPKVLESLTDILEKHASASIAGQAASYGPGFHDNEPKLSLPDSDPNKIRDVSQILALGHSGALTAQGVERMLKEQEVINHDPNTAHFFQQKAEFLRKIEPQIDKTGLPSITGADNQGRQAFIRFYQDLDHRIDQYRAAGKDPFDLIDAHKPDTYMGTPAILHYYQTPMHLGPDEAVPPPNSIDYLKTHPETRDTFDAHYGAGWSYNILGPVPKGGYPKPPEPGAPYSEGGTGIAPGFPTNQAPVVTR